MPPLTLQRQSVILPLLHPTNAELETIDDTDEHTSIEFPTEYLQEKTVHIVATEVLAAGVPGPLWAWIELSPYPSANSLYWPIPLATSTAYWAAIGGGGGALLPLVPRIEVGTGVNLTVHTFTIPWTISSPFARIVLQTPVNVATAWWSVQVMLSGKTP